MLSTELFSKVGAFVKECDCDLYDIEQLQENEQNILRVTIQKYDGIKVEDCEKISKLISPMLDVEYNCNDEYSLEVSSPGAERALKTLQHFKLSIGEYVSIKLNNKDIKIKGQIKSIHGDVICIEQDKVICKIHFCDIHLAKTYIKWR